VDAFSVTSDAAINRRLQLDRVRRAGRGLIADMILVACRFETVGHRCLLTLQASPPAAFSSPRSRRQNEPSLNLSIAAIWGKRTFFGVKTESAVAVGEPVFDAGTPWILRPLSVNCELNPREWTINVGHPFEPEAVKGPFSN